VTTGVYVHVPFCATRCDYCAFATWTDRAHLVPAYVDACILDIERRCERGELTAASTVYFGGGTPSLLPASQLVRILDAIPRSPGAEVTVECNPDSVDPEKIQTLVAAGVTRVSLGVQSTRPHVLAALGRTHDPASVASAIDAVHAAGVPTFNVDLIVGASGETDADFAATLHEVCAFDPPHVSVYGLTVEPGTPLARRVATGAVAGPDADRQAERYLQADVILGRAGLEWYEISNWARPGHECRHNVGYWRGTSCLAIGAAAHGYTGGTRWWNVTRPERYIERIRAGRSPVAGHETLDPRARARELAALALRTRSGAPRAGVDPRGLLLMTAARLVTTEGDRVVLTTTGRLLASEVTLRLWPERADPMVGTRYDGVPAESVPSTMPPSEYRR
jgi:oxygen-independent coproporphyrinogen-3 oxidase